MKLSLRFKAAGVFVALATLPALVTGALLVGVNSDAVRTSERQVQTAVLGELGAWVDLHLASIQDELSSTATALRLQSAAGAGASLTPVRSVVASLRHTSAVRFLVPAANVDTVISRGSEGVPEMPSGLVDRALRDGAAIEHHRGDWLMALRLPGGIPGEKAGVVAAQIAPGPFEERLTATAQSRFGGSALTVLIADRDGNVISSYGHDGGRWPQLGQSPFADWSQAGTAPSTSYSVVRSLVIDGESMLGGIEVIANVGWKVVLWRPEREAYAALGQMQRRTLETALAATILALGLGLFAARRLTRPILNMVHNAQLIGKRKWRALEPLPQSSDELGQLATSLQTMAAELERSELVIRRDVELRSDLSRFMSQQLVERIVSGKHTMDLGGARCTVTVLFADVVGFTPIAEGGEPERVVALLNELFSLMTEVIFRHQGVVDKFLGDSVMAMWGAPEDDPEHATHALRAAEDLLRFVATANPDWQARYGSEIRLGIGVNTGECIVGNIGSEKRMEYTVIGDAVNVAARVEKHAPPGQVLVGEATTQCVDDEFEFAFVGELLEAGRERPVAVHELGVSE